MVRLLPSFEQPPITEALIGLQFDAEETFTSAVFGLIWSEFRDRFPRVEEHAALDAVVESFDAPRAAPPFRIELRDTPFLPRLFFLNEERTELVQIQQDRLIRNWRRLEAPLRYPRYEYLRASFVDDLARFEAVLSREGIPLRANQCELTYVNVLAEGDVFKALTIFKNAYSEDFLTTPEDVRFSLRFLIPSSEGQAAGRLHISGDPAIRRSDGKNVLRLTLTARGAPLGTGTEGILRFLDLGREWIVRGFCSITTPQQHQLWGRTT
jgi:uncharacterized protein (TIGR04255 family)